MKFSHKLLAFQPSHTLENPSKQALFSLLEQKNNLDTIVSKLVFFYGAVEGIRTPDLLVRSQTLYPTELQPLIYIS